MSVQFLYFETASFTYLKNYFYDSRLMKRRAGKSFLKWIMGV